MLTGGTMKRRLFARLFLLGTMTFLLEACATVSGAPTVSKT